MNDCAHLLRECLEPERSQQPVSFYVPLSKGTQDCENAAAKRWLAAYGRRYAALNAVYLGDDLFSRQPLCQAALDAGGHFIFVCKPTLHPLIQEYLSGINLVRTIWGLRQAKMLRCLARVAVADPPLADYQPPNQTPMPWMTPTGKKIAPAISSGRAPWAAQNTIEVSQAA